MKTKDNRRCQKCGSLQTYIRFSTGERICRACGNEQKIERKREEK